MSRHPSDATDIVRAARPTLRRMAAAFGLDRARLHLDLVLSARGDFAVELTFDMGDDGEPFRQQRELRVSGTFKRFADQARVAVAEMVTNVALSHRSPSVGAPSGWSIHPVAASIIAAAGTQLPNPADPLSWLRYGRGQLHLPDGGSVRGAVFTALENILILQHASIVDAGGAVVATMDTVGATISATFEGAFPETCVTAMAGRTANSLCNVFAADPRGAAARIEYSDAGPADVPFLIVQFEDSLVPLLATSKGGERWRPRTARSVVVSRGWSGKRGRESYASMQVKYKRIRHSALRAWRSRQPTI